jgi:hypothetical protein
MKHGGRSPTGPIVILLLLQLQCLEACVTRGKPVGRGRHSETEQPFDLIAAAGELMAVTSSDAEAPTWIDVDAAHARASPLIGTWRHYKGGIYEVHAEATGPSNDSLVVYASDDGRVWLRPREMWSEVVEVGGSREERFRRVDSR